MIFWGTEFTGVAFFKFTFVLHRSGLYIYMYVCNKKLTNNVCDVSISNSQLEFKNTISKLDRT